MSSHLARLEALGDARHHGGDLGELLEAPGVLGPALDDVGAQHPARPAAELHAAARLHAVADRQGDVERAVLDLVGLAVGGSCRKFCDNWPLAVRELLPEGVADVLADRLDVASEQLGELMAAEPDLPALAVHRDGQADLPVRRLEQDDVVSHGSSDPRALAPPPLQGRGVTRARTLGKAGRNVGGPRAAKRLAGPLCASGHAALSGFELCWARAYLTLKVTLILAVWVPQVALTVAL